MSPNFPVTVQALALWAEIGSSVILETQMKVVTRDYFLRRACRAALFLTETGRTAGLLAVVARLNLRRLAAVNLLLTFFDTAFLSFLATVLLFPTNFLPSRSAVCTKLV